MLKHLPLAFFMTSLTVFPCFADIVFEDSFDYSSGKIDKTVWNTGGACRIHGNASMVITTFSSDFGAIGDGTGAAGLNSPTGAATFTVAADGDHALGGNFVVGHKKFNNTGQALARVDFSARGAGLYEVFWNNTDEATHYVSSVGTTGTLKAHSSLCIVNGDTEAAVHGSTAAASGVEPGDPATAFGFWIANKVRADKEGSEENRRNAVIDDFRISSTPRLADEPAVTDEPG